MGFFTRTKTADPTAAKPASPAGKKLKLNLRVHSPEALSSIAAATLVSGGFEEPAPKPKDLEIGDKMPDGTIYAGLSPETGKPMYTTPADAALTMKWQEAMDYAAKLDAHGHEDWHLPTQGELNVLFNNRAAIGEFNVSGSNPAGWYWSGTQNNKWDAWVKRFRGGHQSNFNRGLYSSVRCVRSR